ncbi:MAG: DNA polymerase III subunit delta, partial [Defluviicoccus sp.]|nr:DNA polymerase III subunit delta [Defluviicoccus sp.]
MKIAPARAERFLAAPPEGLRACLFYGPDGGLVRERAQALGRRHVGDLGDAFRVASVAPAALADEPGLLADEAAQLSL